MVHIQLFLEISQTSNPAIDRARCGALACQHETTCSYGGWPCHFETELSAYRDNEHKETTHTYFSWMTNARYHLGWSSYHQLYGKEAWWRIDRKAIAMERCWVELYPEGRLLRGEDTLSCDQGSFFHGPTGALHPKNNILCNKCKNKEKLHGLTIFPEFFISSGKPPPCISSGLYLKVSKSV